MPADTLIPGNNNGQALGIFTANGDVQLANTQSNGNLEIDGSLATICATGTGGCTGNGGPINNGNAINTLTIVGGRIQNQIKNINSTTRNVFFDKRYSQGGFAPPWFPSTTVNVGSATAGTVTARLFVNSGSTRLRTSDFAILSSWIPEFPGSNCRRLLSICCRGFSTLPPFVTPSYSRVVSQLPYPPSFWVLKQALDSGIQVATQ